jgi:hypothetical protein
MKRNLLRDGTFPDQKNDNGVGQMAQAADPWATTMRVDRREAGNHAPILTPVEARQGVISGRVRMILAVSLTLAVISGAIVYAVLV